MKLIDLVQSWGVMWEGQRVLDIGCGYGRWALPLVTRVKRYYGIDIQPEVISACHHVFKFYSHMSFNFVDVYNSAYNPEGILDDIYLPDETFDIAICSSLFTHIPYEQTARYMDEIRDVLDDDGYLFCTFFRSPPNEVSNNGWRTVYPEQDIRELLQGWRVVNETGGMTTEHHDQWMLLCQKKD